MKIHWDEWTLQVLTVHSVFNLTGALITLNILQPVERLFKW